MFLDVLLNGSRENAIALFRAYRRRLDDEGFWNLARSLVGNLDYGTVVDCGVRKKVRFELGGSDLVAL